MVVCSGVWWFAVVCGGLRWFVVVCGGLWWIAVVCLLVIPSVPTGTGQVVPIGRKVQRKITLITKFGTSTSLVVEI